jgi:hypothetical protein
MKTAHKTQLVSILTVVLPACTHPGHAVWHEGLDASQYFEMLDKEFCPRGIFDFSDPRNSENWVFPAR